MKFLFRAMFFFIISASLSAAVESTLSLLKEPILASAAEKGALALVEKTHATPIYVSANDWPGVLRAAGDLQSDVERVSGIKPDLLRERPPSGGVAVIVGTIGRSLLIDELIARGKIDVTEIRGKWESFLVETIEAPFPGVEHALVVAGSDKRGAIYGVYELSQQIGVSPWYWWADVPVAKRDVLHVKPGRWLVGEPTVRYRGIFLNDEAPALAGWAKEKFGGLNGEFYRRVFELLLRLRANYLWPAMWANAFNVDDPENARLADEYGIVMGTSHHEPMMRAHKEWTNGGTGSWDYAKNAEALRRFWTEGIQRNRAYESIITLGMRGDGDEPMSEAANVALLEKIVADQRVILAENMNSDITRVPQLWALYKEVQEYYERGMRVPDDVTLLWCDDNWGNIRRLPTEAEHKRPGGAGVYYHFDYVGGPRNYKWINVTPITKIWEQMHLAWQHEANRIWIVNVGDLKPMEFPIEFFLTYAWDPARWPYEKLEEYSRTWAAREFGQAEAGEIAALINGYSKLNRRRTPELMAPDTYSLVHYREAERVLAEWADLVERAESVRTRLPMTAQDAFFQLVLYPIKASANVHQLYVTAGKNKLYALQGRSATNRMAAEVRRLFAKDAQLTQAYHALGGGKWNHQMSQIKFGYTYWQQPTAEVMPAISEVRPNAGADPAIAIEGSEVAWPVWGAREPVLPPVNSRRQTPRWIEVFNRGDTDFSFTAATDQPWLSVQPATGLVSEITRLDVVADLAKMPADGTRAHVTITTSVGKKFDVIVPVANLPEKPPTGFEGFVETAGYVAIEAPHFSRSMEGDGVEWRVLHDFGRTLGGVTRFPVTAPEVQAHAKSPHLEYDVFLALAGEFKVELSCAPSLDYQPGRELRLAISFDDEAPQIVKLGTGGTLQTWEKSVADSVRRVTTTHAIRTLGKHVLKCWMITPGIVLERIVIDTGGVKPSYLGPPESPRISGNP